MAYERQWAYNFFKGKSILENQSNLGAILDYIRLSYFAIDLRSQFSADSQRQWLNISKKGLSRWNKTPIFQLVLIFLGQTFSCWGACLSFAHTWNIQIRWGILIFWAHYHILLVNIKHRINNKAKKKTQALFARWCQKKNKILQVLHILKECLMDPFSRKIEPYAPKIGEGKTCDKMKTHNIPTREIVSIKVII